MPSHLETYLNDHLAGSIAGIEIAGYLVDHAQGPEDKATLSDVKSEIEKDQKTLESMMKKLDVDQSGFRKASAWLTEKITELKLRFDDPSGSELLVFEALEALSLGIEGKHGLWL